MCIEKEDERRLRGPLVASQLAKPLRTEELRNSLETLWKPAKADGDAGRAGADSVDGDGDDDDGRRYQGVVLIAEDNVINQDVAVGLLDKCGFRAEIARTGREALAMAARMRFDVILMDCQMPEMDGYKAASEIRRLEQSDPQAGKTPIIAMTASAFRGDRERCLAAGMDDCLAKPVTYEKLRKALGKWVKTGEETKPAGAEAPAPMSGGGKVLSFEKDERRDERNKSETVIDPASLQQLRDIEAASRPGFFADIVGIFCRSADEHLGLLSRSVAEGNTVKVEREAHFIKGSAGNFGAKRVMALCQKLEVTARNNDLVGVRELESKLLEEYQMVKEELRRVTSLQIN
jgi:CheY-like chemotaxis protein/HPt (histidine-containing phosphotransfer) domain-containing protein